MINEITIRKIDNGFIVTRWNEDGDRVETFRRDVEGVNQTIIDLFVE